jgi:predicted 3-demethylubiquinone-9 3-methyltransferase (glyoxalase superfamily)
MQKIVPFLWFDGNAEEAAAAMKAMLQMEKLDIDALRRAYEGEPTA